MDQVNTDERRRTAEAIRPRDDPTGHDLIAVDRRLLDAAPIENDVELGTSREHRTMFWRCRSCGAERNRLFQRPTTGPSGQRLPTVKDGGSSITDDGTRRWTPLAWISPYI